MTEQKTNVIDDFLKFYPSKGTKKIYRSVLNKFFKDIDCDPNDYFSSKRDHEDDLYNFALSIQRYAPKSFHSYVIIVKQFFMENGVEVSQLALKRIRRLKPGVRALTRDRLPTLEELKRILFYADMKMKSLILFLLSSGIRIGEACQLKIKDIDFEHKPTKIYLRSEITKTKESRVSFISDEASLHIKEWIKNHDSYLLGAVNRPQVQTHSVNH